MFGKNGVLLFEEVCYWLQALSLFPIAVDQDISSIRSFTQFCLFPTSYFVFSSVFLDFTASFLKSYLLSFYHFSVIYLGSFLSHRNSHADLQVMQINGCISNSVIPSLSTTRFFYITKISSFLSLMAPYAINAVLHAFILPCIIINTWAYTLLYNDYFVIFKSVSYILN